MLLPEAKIFLHKYWRRIAILSTIVFAAEFAIYRGSLFAYQPWSLMYAHLPVIVLTGSMIFAAIENLLPLPISAFLTNRVLVWFGNAAMGCT